jgi:hypothetical protein
MLSQKIKYELDRIVFHIQNSNINHMGIISLYREVFHIYQQINKNPEIFRICNDNENELIQCYNKIITTQFLTPFNTTRYQLLKYIIRSLISRNKECTEEIFSIIEHYEFSVPNIVGEETIHEYKNDLLDDYYAFIMSEDNDAKN